MTVTNVVVLSIHNFLRWAVLALFLVVLFRSFTGWRGKRGWEAQDRMLALVLTISIDIQLVLGLVLYLIKGFAALETFIVMEHIPPMLLAVVLSHVGSAKAKKAERDSEKFRQTALWFSIAFLLILVAIPWMRPLMRLF
ncbi:MAG: hypothetical protein H8E28_11930 [Anaerolineae bacterium]|nr:hypothetical protein [Anaerolineae bacterium]MBL6966322.1 hypothetical protein [Anaerolineales bacterium]